MKKVALLATALALMTGSAFAADMRVKAVKAPSAAGLRSLGYRLRWRHHERLHLPRLSPSRTTSRRSRPISSRATTSPRTSSSMSASPPRASPSRTAPQLKSTSTAVSARPSARSPSTSASGATCIRAAPATTVRPTLGDARAIAAGARARTARSACLNGNVIKKDAELLRSLRQGRPTPSTTASAFGLTEYYSPSFLNSGAWGNYTSITAKYTAPSTDLRFERRRHVRVG